MPLGTDGTVHAWRAITRDRAVQRTRVGADASRLIAGSQRRQVIREFRVEGQVGCLNDYRTCSLPAAPVRSWVECVRTTVDSDAWLLLRGCANPTVHTAPATPDAMPSAWPRQFFIFDFPMPVRLAIPPLTVPRGERKVHNALWIGP